MWKTVREVDVNAIRHEAERSLRIACVGDAVSLGWAGHVLHDGPDRYPPGPDPLALVPLAEAGDYVDLLGSADLVVVALDLTSPLDDAGLAGLQRLIATPRPSQVVLLFGDPANVPAPWAEYVSRGAATVVDPRSPVAAEAVTGAVLDGLPLDAQLAAARRLPGLRRQFASRLTGEVSASNAAVALASGVPSLVPLLGIPLAAADTVILTKNQALMVYRLALACGAPPEFQKRMLEITPVIGGAVMWRQIAGALVGLVPGYGIVPKIAVAYGGTYVVGLAASRWYETGLLTEAERKRLTAEAAAKARDAARKMAEQARAGSGKAGAQAKGGLDKVSRGATAVRAQAGKAVSRARTATGSAGAQARGAAQRASAKGRKAVRRKKRTKEEP
jgi:uncharacterized protein (DUF697 family)